MNINEVFYLFYDKFAGDHNFSNTITKQIKIDDILINNNYTYISGNEAIYKYNILFNNFGKIDEKINEIYDVRLYTQKQEKTIKSYYTIVGINCIMLKKYIIENLEIPNIDFLIQLCRFHISYERASFENNNENIFNNAYRSPKNYIQFFREILMRT